MKKITILGYYGKCNLGDDLFKVAFDLIASRLGAQVTFIEPTQKGLSLPDDCDALIVGGGDIVTSYFEQVVLRLRQEFFESRGRYVPTYAVSIGLSFPENINDIRSCFLDIFDHITFRSKADKDLIEPRYRGQNRVAYEPDLVFSIPRLMGFEAVVPKKPSGGRTLLVCLAEAFASGGTNPKYDFIVDKLASVLEEASGSWDITFMNFDTSVDKRSDRDLHAALQARLSRPTTIIEADDPVVIWGIFQKADRVLAMRFHAHVLAVSTETPLVSLSMTNKTENLMIESGIESCMVRMEKPPRKHHYPIDFDDHLLRQLLAQQDLPAPKSPDVPAPSAYMNLDGLRTNLPPHYLSDDRIHADIERVVNVLSHAVCKHLGLQWDPVAHPRELKRLKTLFRFYYRLSGGRHPNKKDTRLRNVLVGLVEMTLLGRDFTDFYYGLYQQIWSLELSDGIEWILHVAALSEGLVEPLSGPSLAERADFGALETADHEAPGVVWPMSTNKVTVLNGNAAKGFHRSGWSYVMEGVRSAYHDTDAPIILDAYIDKTFHWSRDISLELGIIPYQKPWIGVIHHTPNTDYTEYNTEKLLNDPVFQQCLPTCRGLVVLSENLRQWFLSRDIFRDVPVHALTHPTLFVEKEFDLHRFFAKWRVVQVGGWLRDPYGIYALDPYPAVVKKCALKGKGMENYYPTSSGVPRFEHDDGDDNKYYKGLRHRVFENQESVEIINKLDDDEYDDLLSTSVVFLKLVDVSACNTVVECIVRNTPVLVNRLPALVELLGADYPFFYDSISHASVLAADANAVVRSHRHLARLDKTRFQLNFFLHSLGKVIDAASP